MTRFEEKTEIKCCYGIDIFFGHVIFQTLFKESDWLLRLLFAFYSIFSVNLLLSRKYVSFYLVIVLQKSYASIYWFRLVRSFVLPSIQKKIQARVLKFHIWISRQKIAYPYFFSCPNYLPLPSYAPFKG